MYIHLKKIFLQSIMSWLLLCEVVSLSNFSPRIVQTQYGALRGIIDRFGHGSSVGLHPVEKFLGVPYATPPVKGLRFMPPLTPSPWDGIKSADHLSPSCPQQESTSYHNGHHQERKPKYWTVIDQEKHLTNSFSEDCLYLNIFYPTLDGHVTFVEKPPVVLIVEARTWLQSGANAIDASVMATRGRLMVATVNFRLGILGFLKTSPKENPQGNYGLLDVIAALHWLRLNAPAFGGDASRLTLLGIGQGAALVHLLMLSPMARGLFHGAILLGGSSLSPTAIQPYPEDVRQEVASLAGCWDSSTDSNAARMDLAPCLRRLSTKQLLVISSNTSTRFTPLFAPFVDGSASLASKGYYDFRSTIRDLSRTKTETFLKCDLLVGLATYELDQEADYTRFVEGHFSEEHRDKVLRSLVRSIYKYHNNEIFAVLRNEYTDWELNAKNKSNVVLENLYEALSDGLVVSSLMELIRYHSGVGNGHTFLYHLDYPSVKKNEESRFNEGSVDQSDVIITSSDELRGSFHEDGIFYLLGLSLNINHGYGSPLKAREAAEVSEQLLAYIAGFCYAGDPNEHGSSNNDGKTNGGLIFWEPYTLGEQRYLSLGLRSQIRSHYRSHKMSVWLRLIPQLHQPGEETEHIKHHKIGDNLQNYSKNQEHHTFKQENNYDGIVKHFETSRDSDTFKTSNEVNQSSEFLLVPTIDKETPASSECPTLPQITVLSTNFNSKIEQENDNITLSNTRKTTLSDATSWITHVWTYATMLTITIVTGVAFFLVNLAIVICFCIIGKKPHLSHSSTKSTPQPVFFKQTETTSDALKCAILNNGKPNHLDKPAVCFDENVLIGIGRKNVELGLPYETPEMVVTSSMMLEGSPPSLSIECNGSIIDLTKVNSLLVQRNHMTEFKHSPIHTKLKSVISSNDHHLYPNQSFQFISLNSNDKNNEISQPNVINHNRRENQREVKHEIAV